MRNENKFGSDTLKVSRTLIFDDDTSTSSRVISYGSNTSISSRTNEIKGIKGVPQDNEDYVAIAQVTGMCRINGYGDTGSTETDIDNGKNVLDVEKQAPVNMSVNTANMDKDTVNIIPSRCVTLMNYKSYEEEESLDHVVPKENQDDGNVDELYRNSVVHSKVIDNIKDLSDHFF